MASGKSGGWKHTTGGQSSANTRGTSRRSWQPGGKQPDAPSGKRRSRFGRFLLAGGLAGLLVALIVWVIILWWPGRYPALVVVGPNPAGSLTLPENVAGANAAAALAEWAGGGGERPKPAAPPAETADREAWATKLDRNAKAVVLYFTAHGGVDKDGPFLWFTPADARRPADLHKLRVKEILDRLAGQPNSQAKLLVFDATRTPAGWPQGALFNDFARALRELEPEIAKVEGLAVICATEDDQRSWVSDDLKTSAFGHFLLEGMKGAAGKNPGDRITAAALFDYVSEQVGRWSDANRDEKQTPILLPKDTGRARAEKVEVSSVPAGGYQAPASPEPPGRVPADLAEAWATASDLALRTPPPDTTDPARWREYLDLLVRWERLVRIGENPEAVRGRVGVLAEQLKAPHGAAEPLCLPVGLPVARSLGVPSPALSPDAFRRLWSPPPGVTRADEWSRILGPARANETALRISATAQVIDRVLRDGPSPEVLKTADEVLAEVNGSRVGPAEGHFVRMLGRHLDPAKRPPLELLRAAIQLRVEAEDVAWVGGAPPTDFPHAEQVFRWIRGHIEAGDAARALGQDLLFDADPKSWQLAEQKYFREAREHYGRARGAARVVAAALAARDTILTRLPYYARWLANYRGKLTPKDIDALLGRAELAAQQAHAIAALVAKSTAEGDDTAAAIKQFAEFTARGNAEFEAVVKAFDAEVAGLSNVTHPSNWHSLDNALTVPFIPAKDRVKLLGFVRDVGFQLATKSEQRGGAAAPAVPAQELARRHGRMALAVLGGDPELRAMIDQPKQGAWWESYREAGDRIGRRFRGLPDDAATEAAKAVTAPELRGAAPFLAKAAYLARLADPAAPLDPTDPPPAAEQRYWRHYLLLWQAKRATTEGWADVAAGPPDQWYCRKAVKLLIDSAEELVRGNDPNMSPTEIDRRLADARAERARVPASLDLFAPPERTIADEPSWEFAFRVTPSPKAAIGFPVYWLTPPGLPYTQPNPGASARKLEAGFVEAKNPEVTQTTPFAGVPRTADVTTPGKLTTTVLYRGHRYEKVTDVLLAGTPTLDWRYTPPKGDAAFAVIAPRELVAGTVTLVIDLSGSMGQPVPGTNKKRIQETIDAIEKMLDDLPQNTTLTIAAFWGTPGVDDTRVEPIPGVAKLLWRAEANQKGDVLAAVKKHAAPVDSAHTPLAKSVARVLDKEFGKRYWPAAATGTRTLIVLTDGADTSDKDAAGQVILDNLLTTPEDTAFHLIFFGLDAADTKAVETQYRVLEDRLRYRNDRTPARLWRGVRDANALADALKRAMLPQILYQRDVVAENRKVRGRLQVTLPGEGLYRRTPALAPGVYDLFGFQRSQRLELRPGDRVLLRGRKFGEEFDLSIPAFAFETADDGKNPRPRTTTRTEGGTGIHMTIPALALDPYTEACDLKLVATLEPLEGAKDRLLLKAPTPEFAWFDVVYADGKPAEKGIKPGLRVQNRPGLLAPAWDLTAVQWDRNRNNESARRPAVTGYWVEGLPATLDRYPVDLKNPQQTPLKVSAVRGHRVEPIGFTIEKNPDAELPPGDYLTVRLKYGEPGKPVFLRPGKLKGTNQPFALHERHLYFDGIARYTARFGPLEKADLEGGVDLELYAVSEIKERATGSARSATIRFPQEQPLPTFPLSGELTLYPAKE